jgi:hypothetical protein
MNLVNFDFECFILLRPISVTLIGRWVLYELWGKAKEDVVEDVSSHETPTNRCTFPKLKFVLKLVVKPYTQTW